MANEDLKVIYSLRDLLVENIEEIIYDEEDTSLNNISTNNPDQLFYKSTIPHFALFCQNDTLNYIINKELHTKILYENDDGSVTVWIPVGTTTATLFFSILHQNPKEIKQLSNKIKSFLLNTLSFTVDYEYFTDNVDLIVKEETYPYKSGEYPYRIDLILQVNYFRYKESLEYPADNIELNLLIDQDIPEENILPPKVDSETIIEEIPNGIRVTKRKI